MTPSTSSGSATGGRSSLYILVKFLVDEGAARRTAQAVNAIGAQGANTSTIYRRALDGVNKELELLAQQIAKIEDPSKRKAFTDRFEQLRLSSQQMINQAPRIGSSLSAAYQRAVPAVHDMVTEVKVLNAEQQEVIRQEKEFEKGGFRESFRWGITGFAMSMAGQSAMRAGMAVASPMTKFIQSGNIADPMFRRWDQTSKRLEGSFIRIGRVMISQILPTMEKVARLAEKMAAYVEKHPGVAKAALGVSGGLVALGGFMTGLGQILSITAAFKSLKFLAAASVGGGVEAAAATGKIATGGASTTLKFLAGGMFWGKIKSGLTSFAAGIAKLHSMGWAGILTALITKLKAFGAVLSGGLAKLTPIFAKIGSVLAKILGTAAGAVVGGIGAGLMATEALSRTKFGQQLGSRPVGQYATVAAYGAGKLIGGEDTGMRWARKIAEIFGYVEKSSKGAEAALTATASAFDAVAADATKMYQDYQEAEQEAATKLGEDIAKTETEYEEKRTDIVSEYGQARVDLEKNYEQQRSEIIADYERDRSRYIQDANRKAAQSASDYARGRARELEDYNRETIQRYEQYVSDQKELAEDMQNRLADLQSSYYEDIEEAREDHLRKLREMEREHQFRVDDLVAARDALGLKDERRRHELEVTKENEDYQDKLNDLKDNISKERAAIQEEYARRLAEMKEQFAIEEQRRKEDFEREQAQKAQEHAIQVARDAEDLKLELEQRKVQFEEKLAQLAEDHKLELEELQRANEVQLKELQAAKTKELLELRKSYERERIERAKQLNTQMKELLGIQQQGYDAMTKAAKAYVDALVAESNRLGVAGGNNVPQVRQFGGYASGIVRTGERGPEFVLSNDTTRAAERMVGGRLSQANILSGLAAAQRRYTGGRGTSQINVSQKINFSGALTAAERASLRKMVRAETRAGVLEAIGEG